MGLNNLHAPSEIGESKLDKNWWGICRALRPVCEFLKEIKEPVAKKLFGNRFRVSGSKNDFSQSDLKKKLPKRHKLNDMIC